MSKLKKSVGIGILSAAAMLCLSGTARAQSCYDASGKFNEVIISLDGAPNDPGGRVVGNVDGTLAGATTAFISSVSPIAGGGLHVTTVNAFATLEGNLLFATGVADWTYIKPNFYSVDLTLTITGGTNRYAGATGTLHILGIGNQVGAGSGQFIQDYRGTLCSR